jgi:WD40 repeat protein
MQGCLKLQGGQNGSRDPLYSLDFNERVVVAGTHEDIVVWDLKHTKQPLIRLQESHNDDITGLQLQGDKLISCSIDNVLSMFSMKEITVEEDMIEGAYSSTQPLIACGFVTDLVIWS